MFFCGDLAEEISVLISVITLSCASSSKIKAYLDLKITALII